MLSVKLSCRFSLVNSLRSPLEVALGGRLNLPLRICSTPDPDAPLQHDSSSTTNT